MEHSKKTKGGEKNFNDAAYKLVTMKCVCLFVCLFVCNHLTNAITPSTSSQGSGALNVPASTTSEATF